MPPSRSHSRSHATDHTSVGLGADVGLYSEPVLNLSRIKFDAMVGKTPRCITTTAANAALYTALWDRPHGPGESERDDLYVVVPGYFSAAHPDGNRPFLHALELGKGDARRLADEATGIRAGGVLPELDDDLTAIAEVASWCARATEDSWLRIEGP